VPGIASGILKKKLSIKKIQMFLAYDHFHNCQKSVSFVLERPFSLYVMIIHWKEKKCKFSEFSM